MDVLKTTCIIGHFCMAHTKFSLMKRVIALNILFLSTSKLPIKNNLNNKHKTGKT